MGVLGLSNQVEQILGHAEQLNESVAKHNNENSRLEGHKESTLKRLEKQLSEYNQKFGTDLKLEDSEALAEEYKKSVYEIHSKSQYIESVLKAIQDNDVTGLQELTGVDVKQEAIKVPEIHIDMEEMEKQAEKAFEEVQDDTSQVQGVLGAFNQDLGVSDEGVEVVKEEEEQSTESTPQVPKGLNFNFGNVSNVDNKTETIPQGTSEDDDWDETDEGSEEEVSQTQASQMFSVFNNKNSGQKVSGDSSANNNQTVENTKPNFSGMFGNTDNKNTETVSESQNSEVVKEKLGNQEASKETPKPNFGAMFGNVSKQEDTDKQEDTPKQEEQSQTIGNDFFKGLQNRNKEEAKKETDKINNAVNNQQAPPKFDFGGSIDVD